MQIKAKPLRSVLKTKRWSKYDLWVFKMYIDDRSQILVLPLIKINSYRFILYKNNSAKISILDTYQERHCLWQSNSMNVIPHFLESCAGRRNRDLSWNKNVGEIQIMIMLCRKLEFQLPEEILFSPLLKEHEK